MQSSKKSIVNLIVQQCLEHGVRHVVFSPGSRNAPFVLAMDEHPEMNCLVIHDERSAAFFALGMAQQLKVPVAIVCTSGSAPLNYYPAIAEAYYQCVPLVVITADRPKEWVNQGDGQTIVQNGVFQQHVRYSCNFDEHAESRNDRWFIQRETAIAFAEGNGTWKGPIHFNVALNEPLYDLSDIDMEAGRSIQRVNGDFRLSEREIKTFSQTMKYGKKLVLCGQLKPDQGLLEELKIFADDTSVAVLVENTSNLVAPNFIHCIDRTLQAIKEEEIDQFQPDVLITIGGAVVSKRIKSFLRNTSIKEHWKIGHEFPYMDTYQQLSHTILCKPKEFFKQVNKLQLTRNVSGYGAKWKQLDYKVQDKLSIFFDNLSFSDLKAFHTIREFMPERIHLHMGNSSVVRYCQLFEPISTISHWSNRGTSGIDGSTSTACGAAYAAPNERHVLITGDVSFMYDSNALWNRYLKSNLTIVLINNGGGGIFRIIEGSSSSKQLESYFEATHSVSAEEICKAFQLAYLRVGDQIELEKGMMWLNEFDELNRPKLLEIITPREFNKFALDDFFKETKNH